MFATTKQDYGTGQIQKCCCAELRLSEKRHFLLVLSRKSLVLSLTFLDNFTFTDTKLNLQTDVGIRREGSRRLARRAIKIEAYRLNIYILIRGLRNYQKAAFDMLRLLSYRLLTST